jgi:DNA (cytosine-5)-methyltransferase 1
MHGNIPCVVETAGFCTEHSAQSRGIGYEEEVSPTLRAGVTPAVCVKTYDARSNGDGNTVNTITGDHENRITDYTSVVVEPVYCPQGNGIDRADTAGCNGKGWTEEVCYTLNTIDRPAVVMSLLGDEVAGTLKARDYKGVGRQDSLGSAVCLAYGLDRASFNQGANAKYDFSVIPEQQPTMTARGPGAVCTRYIVRRLTPTECARLQGFPDWWGNIDEKDSLTPEEYAFWLKVRNTHAAINGKQVKEYTKAQLLTWYNKLHTDSSEYKMWGNGIALPTALYVMEGIAEVLNA